MTSGAFRMPAAMMAAAFHDALEKRRLVASQKRREAEKKASKS